ncbi:uncharacterized protein [Epargyreus clarus]|uniref:uncharacterized protein n=1 Tax=Epargyreus clarus TaxID=520877 RepID=UPI003C2C1277
MIVFVLLGLLAAAGAAPHYHPNHHRHGPPPPFPRHDDYFHQRFFQDDIFDTRSFWDELRRELLSLDTVVDDFVKHFPTSVSTEGINGDIYRITIPLQGFEEKDIAVKAKKGLVMVQAIHKYAEGAEKSYVDMRTLPACVNESGKWSYENEVLKIEFPVTEQPTPTTEVVTQAPGSREEMEPVGNDARNADVGAERGDVDLLTNEIQKGYNGVEATTYAVDLSEEVEFVPTRQVK